MTIINNENIQIDDEIYGRGWLVLDYRRNC